MPKVYKCSNPKCTSISNATNADDDPWLHEWIRLKIKIRTLVNPKYFTDTNYMRESMFKGASYIPNEHIKLHCCSVRCVHECFEDEVISILVDMIKQVSINNEKYSHGETQNIKKKAEV